MKYPDDYVNKIIWGDCLMVMKDIPDKSIDLVFYDPPYNVKKKYKNYNDSLPPEVYKNFMVDIYKEANRVSKRGVIVYVGGTLTRLFYEILDGSHLIIVHKRAAGVFAGNYMLQYHSMFSTAKPIIKCKDLWDDIRLPGEGYFFREERYDSPGMTSRLLVERVLHHFSLENEIVLDPFMGCGTTAHACKNMKRNFIGIELSKEYCDIAEERINEK
jgi:site-specific DNA-methyltransferase (adenine-specific)